MDAPYDVAIIGGGPGGSTTGAMLKHYHPGLRVLILERETFPRDHIGESQLPPISAVLDEMGCWDKVEAAGFPIKVGATYRWGRSPELWNFEFLPLADFRDEPRPAKFQGQRKQTAFQVDRSIYDQILLDHARDLGCEVLEGTKVAQVLHAGDRVPLDQFPLVRRQALDFFLERFQSDLLERTPGAPGFLFQRLVERRRDVSDGNRVHAAIVAGTLAFCMH